MSHTAFFYGNVCPFLYTIKRIVLPELAYMLTRMAAFSGEGRGGGKGDYRHRVYWGLRREGIMAGPFRDREVEVFLFLGFNHFRRQCVNEF